MSVLAPLLALLCVLSCLPRLASTDSFPSVPSVPAVPSAPPTPTPTLTVFPAYQPCPARSRASPDPRRFYLSTFRTGNETAPDEKFLLEGQGFNSSSGAAGLQHIEVAGKALRFWKKRFFNHPLSSLQFVRESIEKERRLGNDPANAYSMHVDYDTVLTGTSMERLWEKFDCARQGKPILAAAETGCLAGGIMGSLPALETMFAHIVDNEKMYRKLTWKLKWFCDQNALAHWRANNTDIIALDHQQEIFATIPYQTSHHNLKSRNDGVCRNETGHVLHSCVEIFPSRLAFSVDPVTCRVFRDNAVIIKDMPIFEPYLKEMAPDPAVLHGLGGRPSKHLYKELSEKVFRCRKKHLQLGVILQ